MQLLDLGIERVFENFDRLARHRAETRDAVQHRRVQIFGQRSQGGSGHIGIELQQQNGNRLGVFVGEDFTDDLGIEPAQQAEGR